MHRSEALVADGLRALAYTATGGRALPENIAVTYPAHWGSKAVDALGSALSRVSEWSNRAQPLMLIPDAAATLFAVRANPGIPARGTVAVCDFGGSGTSITLMDAAGDYQPHGPDRAAPRLLRRPDRSGAVDRRDGQHAEHGFVRPVRHVGDRLAEPAAGRLPKRQGAALVEHGDHASPTSCRAPAAISGSPGTNLTTRSANRWTDFVAVLDETWRATELRDLVAVVSVGGGANIPAVTTTLSGHLRVPVVTTPRPQLTAAIGAALRAARGPGDDSRDRRADPGRLGDGDGAGDARCGGRSVGSGGDRGAVSRRCRRGLVGDCDDSRVIAGRTAGDDLQGGASATRRSARR